MRFPIKALAALLLVLLQFMALTGLARAVEIQEVTSPGGIKAWLVEDRTIPLVAMNFSFRGGSTLDPVGKEGLANFLTGMFDEGAGDIPSAEFQARMNELAFKMSFSTGLDNFEGSFQTLSKRRDESFALLALALTKPRFDPEPLERVRGQFVVGARNNQQDPERIASTRWMQKVFTGHPYARDSEGTPQTLAAITAGDLRDLHGRLFTREGLLVAVVGDIDAETLGPLLDRTFGGLPERAAAGATPRAELPAGPALEIVERAIPQSIIMFGGPGIPRNDPDFIPAYVMSFILGGGGFGSRLTEELRERRGLTYGIGFGLFPLEHAGLVIGSLSTRNDKAGEAIGLVRDVIRRFAEEGPTEAELAEVKTYLTGSYALRFDSNAKIANQLLGIQQDGLGIDYVNRRNALVEAVTMEQVKAQARRLLDADRLIITIVGKPEGIKAQDGSG
jgi:zinc protease